MDELITHLVSPFLQHPQDCGHQIIEKKATLIVELKLNDEDKESFTDENKFAVQHLLSLATGRKKPVLELVDTFSEIASESEFVSEEGEASDESSEAGQEESTTTEETSDDAETSSSNSEGEDSAE